MSEPINNQNKDRKTKLNNVAVILRDFISFSSGFRALNYTVGEATAITVAQHTTQTENGKPLVTHHRCRPRYRAGDNTENEVTIAMIQFCIAKD